MRPHPRRPLDDAEPDGYMEGDRDFVLNNLDWCVQQLEQRLRLPKRRSIYDQNWFPPVPK